MQFSHVTSPLSLRTTWANFFQQLATRPRAAEGAGYVTTQQRVVMNVADPGAGIDMSAIPAGEGPDVHYQSIGKRILTAGDSLALDVASGEAPYERIVEWIIPDTRDANGRYIRESEHRQDPDKYDDAPWDAVRFKNPLPFPMTTAVAATVAQGRFLGQQMSYWTNTGEQASVRVTKALSIRTRHVENEEPGERKVLYIAGDDYQKVTVKSEISVSNHRNESVKLVIRRQFSGSLLEADGKPECVLREEGVWSVNERNELTWTLTLEPGEAKTLTYRYTALVNI
jgi:hypothetical protein